MDSRSATARSSGDVGGSAQRKGHRGKTLGDSLILGDEIGRGAYASVYKGLELKKGGFVAIKQFSLSGVGEDELGGIMQEIDLLKELRHKNIVEYMGSIRTRSHLYIIMEYVENGSLANIVRPSKFGPFPESLVAVYIAQVLEGLAFLHEQGVIHRDIKGANILTTKEGVVKLADFGVALRSAGSSKTKSSSLTSRSKKEQGAKDTKGETGAETVVGTPYWMAPEVIDMSGVSEKSDIWSVGCTAIELLTSSPPYYDLQPMSAMFRIVQDEFVPIPAGVSERMGDFLQTCFQKDPKLRPSAVQLLRHKWIRTSKKELQASWKKEKGKLKEHEGVASVVERMVHRVQRSDSADIVDSEDTKPVMAAVAASGAAVGAAAHASTTPQNGREDAALASTPPRRDFGEGSLPSSAFLEGIILEVQAANASHHTGGTHHTGALNEMCANDGSTSKTRVEAAEMQSLVSELDIHRTSEDLLDTIKCLEEILGTRPERRHSFIDLRGIGPLIELLDVDNDDVVIRLLHLIGTIVRDDNKMLEDFCILGLSSVVTRYVNEEQSEKIRAAAADLIFQMSAGSCETVKLLVACEGIPALASLMPLADIFNGLEEIGSFLTSSKKYFMVVDSLFRILELHITTHRGDLCHLFARCSIIERLVYLLASVLKFLQVSITILEPSQLSKKKESKRSWFSSSKGGSKRDHEQPSYDKIAVENMDKRAALYSEKLSMLLLVLANSGDIAKSKFCEDHTAQRFVNSIQAQRKSPSVLLRLVQIIRLLTMYPSALEPLQRAEAIPLLITFLKYEKKGVAEASLIPTEALTALYNMCQINPTRQEQAALANVIPSLLEFAQGRDSSECMKLAMQQSILLLFAMAHSSRKARAELSRHNVVELYLEHLSDSSWRVPALDAIATWLINDPSTIENILLQRTGITQILGALTLSTGASLVRVLELYLTILSRSKKVCIALCNAGLSPILINMLEKGEPRLRLVLVKAIRVMYEYHPKPRAVSGSQRLRLALESLASAEEEMILVKQIAQGLLAAFAVGGALS